jgi:hypothetical protein
MTTEKSEYRKKVFHYSLNDKKYTTHFELLLIGLFITCTISYLDYVHTHTHTHTHTHLHIHGINRLQYFKETYKEGNTELVRKFV